MSLFARILTCSVVVVLSALSAPAYSAPPVGHTGNPVGEAAIDVETWCKGFTVAKYEHNGSFSFHRTPNNGFCWGAFGTLLILSKTTLADQPKPALGFCPPDYATRVDYIKIFSKYVEQNPQIEHEDFAHVAVTALTEAFPCRGPADGASGASQAVPTK